MGRNGDFEAGMCSVTTFEKNRSNSRECHTEDNFVLCMKVMAECVVKKGLSSASWPIKKENLSRFLLNSRNNLVQHCLVRMFPGCSQLSQHENRLLSQILHKLHDCSELDYRLPSECPGPALNHKCRAESKLAALLQVATENLLGE